jgi:hypothetical protein
MLINFTAPLELMYGRMIDLINEEWRRSSGSAAKSGGSGFYAAAVGGSGSKAASSATMFGARATSEAGAITQATRQSMGRGEAIFGSSYFTSAPAAVFASEAIGGRSMAERLTGIAGGSQPAVVKLMSYGSGRVWAQC